MAKNIVSNVLGTTVLANGSTLFSAPYYAEYASGFASVLITLAGSSNVTITQQASMDGTNFYSVVDSTGGALGAVASAVTSTAGIFVQFAPVVAQANRFKVVAAANSTVTLVVCFSEQS